MTEHADRRSFDSFVSAALSHVEAKAGTIHISAKRARQLLQEYMHIRAKTAGVSTYPIIDVQANILGRIKRIRMLHHSTRQLLGVDGCLKHYPDLFVRRGFVDKTDGEPTEQEKEAAARVEPFFREVSERVIQPISGAGKGFEEINIALASYIEAYARSRGVKAWPELKFSYDAEVAGYVLTLHDRDNPEEPINVADVIERYPGLF